MGEWIAGIIHVFYDGANSFGGLQATAIWALFCMTLGAIVAYDKREAHRKDMTWSKIRTDDALNDAKMADALHLLAEDNQRRTETLRELKTIIDERLARR